MATRPTWVSTGTSRQAVGEEQHAGRGLAPDARQRREGAARLLQRRVAQPGEVEVVRQRAQLLLDAARLLDVQSRPGWIAASTSSTGASRTASQEGNPAHRSGACARRRRRNATSRLRSFVDCERTVRTSSPSGSPCGRHDRHPVDVAQALAHRADARAGGGARPAAAARRHGRAAPGRGVTTAREDRVWPVPEPSERTATVGGQPVFWRDGGRAARTRPARPSSTSTASRRARTTGCPSCAATGGLAPDLPGFGRSGKRGDGDFTIDRLRGLRRALPRPRRGRPRPARRPRLGRGRPAVGPAPTGPRRAARRPRRRPLRRRLPLAPGGARVAHARPGRGRDGGHDAVRAAPLAARELGRRRLAALRPGHPAGDPAALPQQPGDGAGRRRRAARPTSPARHSSSGARRTRSSRRASPTPTRRCWAARWRSSRARRRPLAVVRPPRGRRPRRRVPECLDQVGARRVKVR